MKRITDKSSNHGQKSSVRPIRSRRVCACASHRFSTGILKIFVFCQMMVAKQIGDSGNSSITSAENASTVIADKTHLANLIATLKSELAMANSVLEIREQDCNSLNGQLEHKEREHSETKKRLVHLEKQCDNYRETVGIQQFPNEANVIALVYRKYYVHFNPSRSSI